jgi:sulfopyruvate decarboxylase TPP-binding subunit
VTYFVRNTGTFEWLGRELVAAGFEPFVAVRCGVLAPLHDALDLSVGVLTVPREDNAIGISAGAALAGGHPAVLLPDSAPGTAGNVIAATVTPDPLPILLVIGVDDDPATERAPVLRLSAQVLDDFGIESVSFDPAASPTEPVARVRDIVQVRLRPAALLVPAALPIPEHATRPLP